LDQILAFAILAAALGLFVWGRLRHDIVALLILLAVIVAGLVPAEDAFDGFGHPAVVTVAAVLVLSRGLQNAGLVETVGARLGPFLGSPTTHVLALAGATCLLSAFMNNVGALALMMPVALGTARKLGRSPALLLMPIAFASLLGGMTTLIGTPPNIIVSGFRAESGAGSFGMFDFAPVGVGIAAIGLAYLALLGWRLVPKAAAERAAADHFRVADYFTEVRLKPDSEAAGKTIAAFQRRHAGILVSALIRGGRPRPAPPSLTMLEAGDILAVRADTEELEKALAESGMELVPDVAVEAELLSSEDVLLMEAVVGPDSPLLGRSPGDAGLRARHSVNLLALARRDGQVPLRLGQARFRTGDVLLLQGTERDLADTVHALGCMPLAERDLKLSGERRLAAALLPFGAAIAIATLGLLPAAIALTAAAVIYVLLNLVPLREMYESIDWPVIVLLGAMFPLGEALQSTGASAAVAGLLIGGTDGLPMWLVLALILAVTMCLSDVINNAATAVVMCPIAVAVSKALDASPDAFLMAVAIGASCAFLTPIGHQSNTLVMGPGGYRFGDYWRVGLALELAILVAAVPLLMWAWPP